MFSQIYFHQFVLDFFQPGLCPLHFFQKTKSQPLAHMTFNDHNYYSTWICQMKYFPPLFSDWPAPFFPPTFLRPLLAHFWGTVSYMPSGFQSVFTRPFCLGCCSSHSTLHPQPKYTIDHSSNDLFHSIFSQLCFLNADWLAFLKNFSLYL